MPSQQRPETGCLGKLCFFPVLEGGSWAVSWPPPACCHFLSYSGIFVLESSLRPVGGTPIAPQSLPDVAFTLALSLFVLFFSLKLREHRLQSAHLTGSVCLHLIPLHPVYQGDPQVRCSVSCPQHPLPVPCSPDASGMAMSTSQVTRGSRKRGTQPSPRALPLVTVLEGDPLDTPLPDASAPAGSRPFLICCFSRQGQRNHCFNLC